MRQKSLPLLALTISLLIINASYADKIEVGAEYDFKLALDYVFTANVDTIVLSTSGGVYTTTDSMHLAIKEPLTIIAKEGLAEMPILTNSDMNGTQDDILRVYEDLTVEGVIFDGGHAQSHGMKYALRMENYSGDFGEFTVNPDADLTVRNCIFRDFFDQKDLMLDGHIFKIGLVKGGTIIFENCHIANTGYEAIRISDTEKWATDKAMDTLIVRNCTFENIDAECIRVYGDTDTSTTADAPIFIENVTVNNSASRVMYVKNNKNTVVRNFIITNSRLSGHLRDDFIMQIQLPGSMISNMDTMNISTLDGSNAGQEFYVSKNKGKGVDHSTIWGFDPLYTDPDNHDYTLQAGSHAYFSGYDGGALGDAKWATQTPTVVPFSYSIEGNGTLVFEPALEGQCFDGGASVTVTAVPDSANEFVGWGGDLSGSENPATFTMDAAKSISATFQTATAIETEPGLPAVFKLDQNYPNPFNPETTIEYALPSHAQVTLEIFNLQGELIQTLVQGSQNAGSYTITWRPENVSSGVYVYRLKAGSNIDVRKLMFIK